MEEGRVREEARERTLGRGIYEGTGVWEEGRWGRERDRNVGGRKGEEWREKGRGGEGKAGEGRREGEEGIEKNREQGRKVLMWSPLSCGHKPNLGMIHEDTEITF